MLSLSLSLSLSSLHYIHIIPDMLDYSVFRHTCTHTDKATHTYRHEQEQIMYRHGRHTCDPVTITVLPRSSSMKDRAEAV